MLTGPVEPDCSPTRSAWNSPEERVAAAIWGAQSSGTTLPPPRLAMPNPTLAAGYRVQSLNARRRESTGGKMVGHKIGMTSIAIQKQFGIDHPTRGSLFDSMIHPSGAQAALPPACSQGRAEGEIAFVMRHDLDAGRPTLDDTLDAIAYALPAIEIVNSRVANWDVTPFDFVADNAAAEFAILGSDKIAVPACDLAMVTMEMELNGKIGCRGTGADCLGSPVRALHWLALHLIEHGGVLRKNDIVMSGSLGPALSVKPGDTVRVRIGDLAPVCVQFTEKRRNASQCPS